MNKLHHSKLTGKIIGVYYDVYNGLGQGYPEYIYEQAMMRTLKRLAIPCVRQDEYEIYYKDWLVGVQRLDIFVTGEVVVELKVRPELSPINVVQTVSYLKTVGKEIGLLFNFGGAEPEFKRVIHTLKEQPSSPADQQDVRSNLLYPELSYEVIGSLFAVHHALGPGFVKRIYANACYREMQSRGLDVRPLKQMTVYYQGEILGTIKLAHFLVEGCLMVFPAAIGDLGNMKPQNLRHWMASQQISLGILANFNDAQLKPVFMKETDHTGVKNR